MICSVYWGFVFFFFFFSIRGFALLFTICWVVFFCLDWVCFTFRIDVGLFCGLALLQIFFFFPDFNSKIFLGFFFFFCLKVEQIIFLFFLFFLFEGVHNFF